MKHNLFSDVFSEFGSLTNQAWLLMCIFGIVMAGAELLGWSGGPGLSAVDYVSVSVTVPLGLFAAYFAGMSMVSRRVSGIGFFRLVGGVFALFLCLMLGMAVILALLPSPYKSMILTVAIILMFFGWLTVVFLPAWPIAQALSSKLISPVRLLRDTKGYRWSLFLMSFVGGSLNNIVPSTAKARNFAEAMIYAVGNSVASVFTITITIFIALSVMAWRYASVSDQALYGDDPRAAGVL